MLNDNNDFRRVAHKLGDLLKQPENVDLKECFIGYNATKEPNRWGDFESPSEEALKWYKAAKQSPPLSALTPEQTTRWYGLLDQCEELRDTTGSVQTYIYLLAQLYLGRVDVLSDKWK